MLFNLVRRFFNPSLVSQLQRRRNSHSKCREAAEVSILEPRTLLAAALPDLVAGSIDTPTSMIAGKWYSLGASVRNEGAYLPVPTGSTQTAPFRVEFRLSTDATIDRNDLLLATTYQSFVNPNRTSRAWTQPILIPSTVTQGSYYIGMMVDPLSQLAEKNETNNIRSAFFKVTVQLGSVAGTVTANGVTKGVNLVNYGANGQAISTSVPTWVVIHGRITPTNNASTTSLAGAISDYTTGDQVLVLDWTQAAASTTNGGEGEAYITAVAAWAAATLKTLGFSGSSLNLVGHDMGAYVAAEMAKSFGSVNSIVAIDPAKDYADSTYNPEATGAINFAANSRMSWAFFEAGTDALGSSKTPTTATEQFAVTGTTHNGIVSIVAALFRRSATNPIGKHFQLSRLLLGRSNPLWQTNRYNFLGRRGAGPFEASIAADVGVKSLSYVDANGVERIAF